MRKKIILILGMVTIGLTACGGNETVSNGDTVEVMKNIEVESSEVEESNSSVEELNNDIEKSNNSDDNRDILTGQKNMENENNSLLADEEDDGNKENIEDQSTNITDLDGDTYTDEEIAQILKEIGIEVDVAGSTVIGTPSSGTGNNGSTGSGYVDPDFAGVDTSAKPGTGGDYKYDSSYDPNVPTGIFIE